MPHFRLVPHFGTKLLSESMFSHCQYGQVNQNTIIFNEEYDYNLPSAEWQPCCFSLNVLTHWSRDKMAAISQMTLSMHFRENVRISIEFSLKFVSKGPINNIPALVQIMAWRCSGDKPLSEPMMVRLPTHICVARPQCVKKTVPKGQNVTGDSYM